MSDDEARKIIIDEDWKSQVEREKVELESKGDDPEETKPGPNDIPPASFEMLVTSIGTGRQAFWDAVLEGRHGFGPVESFDSSAYRVHVGGEVKDFDPGEHVRRLDPASIGRASQFAIAAAQPVPAANQNR